MGLASHGNDADERRSEPGRRGRELSSAWHAKSLYLREFGFPDVIYGYADLDARCIGSSLVDPFAVELPSVGTFGRSENDGARSSGEFGSLASCRNTIGARRPRVDAVGEGNK